MNPQHPDPRAPTPGDHVDATPLAPGRLVGAWRLARWEIIHSDGTTTEPFGAGAEGLLVYSADGWMSAAIMAAGRSPLSRGNPRQAPEAERAAAFDGYFSYGGRWRIVGQCVRHDVCVALNPALVGTPQWRDAVLEGDSLTLSARESATGAERLHRLRWRRAAAEDAGR